MHGHKWFAAIYDLMMAAGERRIMGTIRDRVAGGAAGCVLELGAGTGLNFPHYTTAVASVQATEPDPYMLQRARRRAAEAPVSVNVTQAPAERLPFDDASFDTVVETLVFCTVRNPAKALAEAMRVLRPGGQLRFYDHIRYDSRLLAHIQDLATPVWSWWAAGCHPNRDTVRAIREAGFDIREIEYSKPFPPVPPATLVRPHVRGIAIRP